MTTSLSELNILLEKHNLKDKLSNEQKRILLIKYDLNEIKTILTFPAFHHTLNTISNNLLREQEILKNNIFFEQFSENSYVNVKPFFFQLGIDNIIIAIEYITINNQRIIEDVSDIPIFQNTYNKILTSSNWFNLYIPSIQRTDELNEFICI